MREPYAQTLWMFQQLQEHDRFDRILHRARDLHRARLTAMAMHDPPQLDQAHQQLLDDAGLLPSAEEAHAKTASVIEAMRRIEAGILPTEVVG